MTKMSKVQTFVEHCRSLDWIVDWKWGTTTKKGVGKVFVDKFFQEQHDSAGAATLFIIQREGWNENSRTAKYTEDGIWQAQKFTLQLSRFNTTVGSLSNSPYPGMLSKN